MYVNQRNWLARLVGTDHGARFVSNVTLLHILAASAISLVPTDSTVENIKNIR